MSGTKNKVEYKVQLLDDSTISCRVEKGSKGEELINQVCTFLELEEKDYFGLCYSHSKQTDLICWLKSKKQINKQIGSSSGGCQFRFRVKFYPPDPNQVSKEMTRYLFVCQLKKDIAEDKLTCSVNTECLLAAYALQAEAGDHDSEENIEESDITQCAWFFNVTPNMESSIRETYKSLRGMSPAEADFKFLDIVRKLELYGIHQQEAIDRTGTKIHLATVWNGIIIFRCGSRQNSFPWSKVYKLDFKGRHFYVILKTNSDNIAKDTLGFKFLNKQASKSFWRRCVEYHAFSRSKRRDVGRANKLPSRSPENSSSMLTRGAPGRSTISAPQHKTYNEFTDRPTDHSTPRSKEAEDIRYDGTDRAFTLDRPSAGSDVRAYATLPPNYRKQAPASDTLSSKFDSSVISVDSGSYNLGGTSQDDFSDSFRHSPVGLLKNDLQSNEEFAAIFQQISKELVTDGHQQTSEPLNDLGSSISRTSSHTSRINMNGSSSPPQQLTANNVHSSLTKVSSIASMPSRTSSKGSLASDVLEDSEPPITIPLDLLLDVGKSMPDTGFANYLSRYTKAGYSRLHAITQEYIYTEKTYVKILGILNTFLREITIPNGPFSAAQVSMLGNLYEMHQKFLRQLEDRLDSWNNDTRSFNIADVLARNLCLFSLYSDYISDYGLTIERFNQCYQEEIVFAKHVNMFEGRSSSIVCIPNLLLYPVLRVKQYQDLIEKLIGCVGENDPTYPDFNDVYHEINKNTPPLTQELPKIMNSTVLQSLESECRGVKDVAVLGRVFLRRGLVKHVTATRALTRTLILLSDCLLYCMEKEREVNVLSMLPVKDIEIEECGDKDEGVFSFVVNVVTTNQMYEFYVEDKRDREKWVHDVIFAASTYSKRRKPDYLPTLVKMGSEAVVQELCMVCGITLSRDKRHRTCKLCCKVLCTRCSSWKLSLPGHLDTQRVCESCFSRGDVRQRDLELAQYTVQPPLLSYGGDDMLSMEQLSGYVYVRSQNRAQWRRRWLELIFSKLFFYESEDDVKPLGSLDLLHLQVSDTRYEDRVSANYAFKITSKTFSIVVATDTRYSLKRWLQVLEKASLLTANDMF